MVSIASIDTAPSAFAADGYAVLLASFTRPANTTAYAAGDVVSDHASTAAAIEFPNAGRSGTIHSATLVVAETDTASFDLLVFETEPTNFADNAALALVTADMAKLVGVFRFDNANKINVGTNIELYRATGPGSELHAAPASYATTGGGKLYGLLVTRSVYTPISAAKVVIRLNIERGK